MSGLNVDQLIETACFRTGREDFGSDSFREGLEILVADINADDRPAPLVERFRGDLVQNLALRLKTIDYHKAHPEISARAIEKPVFVFGIPRTGTTLLSNLLNADPARRSALTWEIEDPFPPVAEGALTRDMRAVKKLEQEKMLLEAMPEMGKYYRNSATYPNECIFFMAHDFKALSLESRGKLPNYRDWYFQCDMTSAYTYHKQFLQVLQHHQGGIWNLKMPSHALWLDTLKTVYPDARLVWTHRDPLTAMGSFCSIISLAHKGYAGRVDAQWIAQNCTFQAVEHARRIMDYRERHGEESIVDVHYAALRDDPLGQMKALYAALGDEWTPEAEDGMTRWLAANPQDKFGRHEYKLAQFGLDEASLRPEFGRYLARYDVAREG
ncbi:sulfotransferase family protein [Novosphingobium mangrovi (ex Hu et al. 2023)]|uniref:Sulfotransferase n=1 Tax=Novosphingobium mangrovi (ex Hu et al. 2023) TaxID=2930094 RepID=A0ABT0AEP7_9SPHN|nr:sulfotransferase [Novosphingobium mangrovi (ex Hu et al. 2023)]MCJ1961661.1 sulfotransferase [Novosphingobium mangrovi (ex Hu et al. 2023)]